MKKLLMMLILLGPFPNATAESKLLELDSLYDIAVSPGGIQNATLSFSEDTRDFVLDSVTQLCKSKGFQAGEGAWVRRGNRAYIDRRYWPFKQMSASSASENTLEFPRNDFFYLSTVLCSTPPTTQPKIAVYSSEPTQGMALADMFLVSGGSSMTPTLSVPKWEMAEGDTIVSSGNREVSYNFSLRAGILVPKQQLVNSSISGHKVPLAARRFCILKGFTDATEAQTVVSGVSTSGADVTRTLYRYYISLGQELDNGYVAGESWKHVSYTPYWKMLGPRDVLNFVVCGR